MFNIETTCNYFCSKYISAYNLKNKNLFDKVKITAKIDHVVVSQSGFLGIVWAISQRTSSSASSLILYLDLINKRQENPVSQRYVRGNGRRILKNGSDITE
ncbi:hypothetical protein RF11_06443 [Thelohanellus kitauei]|uniref:Uncharacterized protein n=1 Tax=Thelohanellus kitauei TaxID=669202 RepID=A0A0C2MZ84_THEKT|nr:hypothetical protein RF11_06443 [Thelohanellus kitauei]